ncbi:hypothetical protein [Blastococcus capsensis]|uniref:hypothetical protein n=1 Tax=Blastococcus capsensis TaxID=1564163 RepID=UPI002541539D|nr:hypothetical protein [Blastococcus capsensis]MDK3258288.1 hypothetical protein [Blastococcus capsensis]
MTTPTGTPPMRESGISSISSRAARLASSTSIRTPSTRSTAIPGPSSTSRWVISVTRRVRRTAAAMSGAIAATSCSSASVKSGAPVSRKNTTAPQGRPRFRSTARSSGPIPTGSITSR